MKELSEKEALYKAAAYCSASEHCCSEVAEKLKGWGMDVEASKRIIAHLIQEKYIDERRYCRFFVNDKLRYNKWGRNKILQALRQKRIPQEVLASAFDNIEEQEYQGILKELLLRKRKSVKAKNDYELNGKLVRFALGRGFEMELIQRCINYQGDEGE